MLTLTDDKLLKFVLILGKSCVAFVWGEKLGWPRTLFIILLLSFSFSNGYPYSFVTNITKSKNQQASDREPATEIKSTAVLPYIKGLSESLRRCLQHHGAGAVRSVFKSDTTLRSVRPKDPVDPRKQDKVVIRFLVNAAK